MSHADDDALSVALLSSRPLSPSNAHAPVEGAEESPSLQDLLPLPLSTLDAHTLAQVQRAYPHLTELNLDSNELRYTTISPLLSTYLPALRSLRLSCNHLTRVPDVGALPHLTALDLRGNTIAHVEHLARCSRLEMLDLSHNQIHHLPSLCAEIIMECPGLTSLYLHHNPLSAEQYRVALISLLPSLRTLDGAVVRAEEKAYLQLLAATQINESCEGQQAEEQDAEEQPAGLEHAHEPRDEPADAALSRRQEAEAADEDDADSDLSLGLSPAPSSHSDSEDSPPSARQEQQSSQQRSAALQLAEDAAAELYQRQERKQQEVQEEARGDAEHHHANVALIPPVELQQPHHEALGLSPVQPAASSAHALTHAAVRFTASERPTPADSVYSSVQVSRSASPVLSRDPSRIISQAPPVSSRVEAPSHAPPQQQAPLAPQPMLLHGGILYAQQAPAPAVDIPAQPSAWIPVQAALPHVAPPAALPSTAAPAAAYASALTEQTQLVQHLREELQQAKESLSREQAHVRTVKAYYSADAPARTAPSHTAAPRVKTTVAAPSSSSSSAAASLSSLFAVPPAPDASAAAASATAMLDVYRSEIAHLKKQNDLLQVQNESTADILRMKDRQSEEMRSLHAAGRGGRAEPDLSLLWRDKVFALLVQNKSLLLAHAAELQAQKRQMQEKDQRITQLEQQNTLLSKSESALRAQLQLLHNESAHRQHVQEQSHLLQAEAQAARQRTMRDVASIRHVLGVFQQQVLHMEESTQAKLHARLEQFNRRITFAQQRVQVIGAVRSRKHVSASAAAEQADSLAVSLPMAESKEDADGCDDLQAQHLQKEINRLQNDRALLYSSWQREVSTLRSSLAAHSSRATAAEAQIKSLQGELSMLRVEADYLTSQNAELRKENASKVPAEKVQQAEQEHKRREEQLEAELSAVSQQLRSLQASADEHQKAHLRAQVELQQTKHALSQAKNDAASQSRAQYEYLEEKLRRREAQHEELSAERRRLQQQIRDMDQQIILLKHGVGIAPTAQPPQLPSHLTAPQPADSYAAAPASVAAAALPRPAATSSFSNLLFGSASQLPVPSFASHAAPVTRPQPVHLTQDHGMQPQRQQQSVFSSTGQSASTASLPVHPIPLGFSHAGMSQAHSLPVSMATSLAGSAASSRMHSRPTSVAHSPQRVNGHAHIAHPSSVLSTHTQRPPQQLQHHAHAQQSASAPAPVVVPPLHFPSSLGVSSPPLASQAAPHHVRSTSSLGNAAASRPASADVTRKLSHLAALSARLLDDDDD